jgi:hypothetical protein
MKHLITLGFLIAAAAMYAFGSELGSGILVGLGMWSELVFWKRLLFSGRKKVALL